MVRVRHAVSSHKRKKRVLKQTKGQFAQKHTRYRQAKRSLIKGRTYAFRDRKVKTRQFRGLWIVRINAACQEAGITYSRFIKGLKQAKIGVNRKMIAELAVHSPDAFKKLLDMAQKAA
jgi:large subunit ribosomal protein L20